MNAHDHAPMAAGTLLAALAAASFGATTPILARAGAGVGPLTSAALLYAGAAISSFAFRTRAAEGAPLTRAHVPRLAIVALFGAALAPTLLAWGLQRAGATTGSLLLNLEAVFTVALAALVHREPIGRRVAVAAALMALGGAALMLGAAADPHFGAAGALAVVGATAAWALDNTLTRPLADLDPSRVVIAKGTFGALCTGTLALALQEPWPTGGAIATLLACGSTGYGLSLRLYLLAQRRIGAARTGSLFALAPFVGALLAWALGDPAPAAATLGAALLFAVGVALHATEDHGHPHVHPALEHDHAHRHDDGHHDHAHDPPVHGEHAHPHRHEHLEHTHAHAPDLHHEHDHG
jgi:drug/metabolite transporter (DMT)-like permease